MPGQRSSQAKRHKQCCCRRRFRLVLSSIVGFSGLADLKCREGGKIVGLANKESLLLQVL